MGVTAMESIQALNAGRALLMLSNQPCRRHGMSEQWYEEKFSGDSVTDKLLTIAFACIPAATLILGLIMWLKAGR
jgi:hypothetical protein